MTGPRLFARTHLLALAALMLLPACSPRKPIPSDPPEVRTEAQVRGARTAPQPAKAVVLQEAGAEPAQAKTDELVARMSEEAKPVDAKSADAMPTQAAPTAGKAEAAQGVEAKAAEVTAKAVTPEPKAEAESAPSVAQDTQTIISEVTVSAEVAAQPEKDAATGTATEAARPAIVQIASFSTEKNAQGALAWLKEKGYSESRVVRVEQGLTVFHRVQAGPFQDLDAARKALEELKITWPQAFIPAD
jgi:hypothetical protein